jgi:hypothetical protein
MSDVIQSYPDTTTRDGLGKRIHCYTGEYAGKDIMIVKVAANTFVAKGQTAVIDKGTYEASVADRNDYFDGVFLESILKTDYDTSDVSWVYVPVAMTGSFDVDVRYRLTDITTLADAAGTTSDEYNGLPFGAIKVGNSAGIVGYGADREAKIVNVSARLNVGRLNVRGASYVNTKVAVGDMAYFQTATFSNSPVTGMEVMRVINSTVLQVPTLYSAPKWTANVNVTVVSPTRIIAGNTRDVLTDYSAYRTPADRLLTNGHAIVGTLASNVVTLAGTGTRFTKEIAPGDILWLVSLTKTTKVLAANVKCVVITVNSNTSARAIAISGATTNTALNAGIGYTKVLGYRAIRASIV